jgi:hypothetical protein
LDIDEQVEEELMSASTQLNNAMNSVSRQHQKSIAVVCKQFSQTIATDPPACIPELDLVATAMVQMQNVSIVTI